MKVLDEYASHHYFTNFDKADIYCPRCGHKEVWIEDGVGDYYCGPQFLCIACDSVWTMQGPLTASNKNTLKKLDQLRTGKTHDPTTREGS